MNYLITDPIFNDYHLGFEVQSPEKTFISWDATYEEVIALPCVDEVPSFSDWEIATEYRFEYPVRVGNVLIPGLKFKLEHTARADIAVQEYRKYYDGLYDDETLPAFLAFKQRLQADLKEREHIINMDGQGITLFYEAQNKILFHLTYFRKFQYHGGSTHLQMINVREYPELLIDAEYENKMQVDDFLLIDEEMKCLCKYKTTAEVKRRPPLLTERFGKQPVCWRDDKNGILGMADERFAIIYPLETLEKEIDILRMYPAKGGGGDFIFDFRMKCYTFDKIGNDFERLTSCKIKHPIIATADC